MIELTLCLWRLLGQRPKNEVHPPHISVQALCTTSRRTGTGSISEQVVFERMASLKFTV